MGKGRRKAVTTKPLIDMIAESSGYYKYEVRDILDHLIAVVTRELILGKSVRIKGLGIFYAKPIKPATWFSGALNKVMTRKPSAVVRYAMDTELRKSIALDGNLVSMLLERESDE